MQLWAFESRNGVYAKKYVEEAESKKNYFCLECMAPVRVRSSHLGLKHFFHLSQEVPCRQSSRSALHINVQKTLLQFFERGAVEEEVRFHEIGRVADIAYYPKKCVFEVQCSWIDRVEAEKRVASYNSIGWDVVWLLSSRRYGNRYASGFEVWLQNHSHYFFDARQDFIFFFDLVSRIDGGRRIVKGSRLLLKTPFEFVKLTECIAQRKGWKVHLKGGFISNQKGVSLALIEHNPDTRDIPQFNLKEFVWRHLKRFCYSIESVVSILWARFR